MGPFMEMGGPVMRPVADVRDLRLQPYQRNAPDKLHVGADHWAWAMQRQGVGFNDWIVYRLTLQGAPYLIEVATGAAKGPALAAFVNGGRWIAQCECGCCEVVDPSDPRFLCLACFNVMNGSAPRLATFPASATVAAAATVLLARPSIATRNWFPWAEKVSDLSAENKANGL